MANLSTSNTGTLPVSGGGTGVTTSTGTGDNVLSTSPTLVTPILGTPTSGDLQNCTIAAEGTKGVVPLASDAESVTGTSDSVVITPGNFTAALNSRAASTATAGIAELATDDESKTGTDTARAVTPANLRAAVSGATTVTTTYTSLITDSVIYGNHATTAFTITLLAAATAGANKRYTIANINAALVTVDGNGSETVGGLPQQCIGQNEAITIDCDGSNWHIVHDARVKSSENLLTNSQLSVWSNSEDLYTTAGAVPAVGDAYTLVLNGEFTTDTDPPPSWTAGGAVLTTEAGGQVGNCMLVTNSGQSNGVGYQLITTEVGKLYEISFYVKKGTATSTDVRLGTGPGTSEYGVTVSTDGGWTLYTVVLEATTTTVSISVYATGADGQTAYIDQVSLHEVTPGIVSATSAGPDGGYWKGASMQIYREHSGSNTKEGSFYALKVVGAAGEGQIGWTSGGSAINAKPVWYRRFAGRTITFGAWVKTDTETKSRLHIHASDGSAYSSYHTGGGGYEWLEVTKTCDSAITSFYIVMESGLSTTAYISQPQLSFGSSIGEGNYVQPPGEVVWCETPIVAYSGYSISSGEDVNVESSSEGKAPKGAKAIHMKMSGAADSASDLIYTKQSSSVALYGVMIVEISDAAGVYGTGWQVCDSNGDFYLTASAGWTGVGIQYQAIQVT
jgi:hypothetical protein